MLSIPPPVLGRSLFAALVLPGVVTWEVKAKYPYAIRAKRFDLVFHLVRRDELATERTRLVAAAAAPGTKVFAAG
jgi:hypothetical protein